jgi:hypothetical protein
MIIRAALVSHRSLQQATSWNCYTSQYKHLSVLSGTYRRDWLTFPRPWTALCEKAGRFGFLILYAVVTDIAGDDAALINRKTTTSALRWRL